MPLAPLPRALLRVTLAVLAAVLAAMLAAVLAAVLADAGFVVSKMSQTSLPWYLPFSFAHPPSIVFGMCRRRASTTVDADHYQY